jgi:hypothetical protein
MVVVSDPVHDCLGLNGEPDVMKHREHRAAFGQDLGSEALDPG